MRGFFPQRSNVAEIILLERRSQKTSGGKANAQGDSLCRRLQPQRVCFAQSFLLPRPAERDTMPVRCKTNGKGNLPERSTEIEKREREGHFLGERPTDPLAVSRRKDSLRCGL